VLGIQDLDAWAKSAALSAGKVPHKFAHIAAVGPLQVPTAPAISPTIMARAAGNVPQVEGAWQSGFGLPILNEYAGAAIEYRGELVVAGWLRAAGAQRVLGIARWTANGWAPLGDGIIPGFALTVLRDTLYAGSWTGEVSRWDGQSWSRLPASPVNRLEALEVIGGVLVVAGEHDEAGHEVGRVASFDGQHWIQLGPDFDHSVTAVGSYHDQIVAGGTFTTNGAAPLSHIAQWDGSRWDPLGAGIDNASFSGVGAIQEYGGRLIVGGWFESCSRIAAPGLASWDGEMWSALPGVPPAYVADLLVANGRLFVTGGFAGDPGSVGAWDGSNWTSEGLGQWTLGLASYAGGVAAVGGFSNTGCPENKTMIGVAVLGPNGWSGLEQWDDTMHGLAHNVGSGEAGHLVSYHGDLIASGQIQYAGSPPGWTTRLDGLARWDGHAWQPVPGAMPSPSTITVIRDDLYAGGPYSGWSPEGMLNGVGRWDGVKWQPLGSGLSGTVASLAEFDGDIYAGGDFEVIATGQKTTLARFDGREWRGVTGAPANARFDSPHVGVLVAMDGLLFVGGNFSGPAGLAAPGVVAWDGKAWHALGDGLNGDIVALQFYRGQLFAGGTSFDYDVSAAFAGGLARWDGSTWSSMKLGGSQVSALGVYGSRLVVGGLEGVDKFVPGSQGIVAWDGESWSGFGTGLTGFAESLCQVGGDLYVGGSFDHAGDRPSFGIARWGGTAAAPDPVNGGVAVSGKPLAIRAAFATPDVASVRYSLPSAGEARLELYDVRGARVATLFDRYSVAGESVFEWSSGSPVPFPSSGVYFLALRQGDRLATSKLFVAR
jgi:hypothetical protein